MAFQDNIKTFASSDLGKHTLLIVGMILLIFSIGLFSNNFADDKAREWLNNYTGADSNIFGPTSASSVNTNALPKPSTQANVSASNSPTASNTNSNASDQTQAGNTNTNTQSQTPINNPNPNVAGAGAANVKPNQKPSPTTEELKALEPAQNKRLEEQLQSIRDRIKFHGVIMAFFYKAYYMAIAVVLFAGVIAAVSLFFIAQSGWGATNQYVKTVFVVMTASVAYYGLYPPVFEQEKNISDNKALFLEYKTLESEVKSYPVTRSNVKHESKEPKDFINYVDSEMARLGQIAIGFDYTKINYKGAFDTTKSTPPAPTPTPKQSDSR